MRTTLTLDDDVIRQLRKTAQHTHRSFKELVNEALRRGLSVGQRQKSSQPRFMVHPKPCGFRPGIDPLKLNQLLDELEVNDFVGKHPPPGRPK